MENILVNKVAESGIITLNLEQYIPDATSVIVFDLKPFLFKELILREKDFRESLAAHDWQVYKGKNVAVTCSADAIIPMWAYMLVASALEPFAHYIKFGTQAQLETSMMLDAINNIDAGIYKDKRVVIKGCGDISIPEDAFVAITQKLRPEVKSLMYGEPCSTVPVYKKK